MQSIGAGVRGLMNTMGLGSGGPRDSSGHARPLLPPSEKFQWAEDYVAFVNNETSRRQRERMPLELEWRQNLEFIQGNQFVEINPVTQTLEEASLLYDWEEREVFNQIAPIYEVRVARLTRGRVVRKVRPASKEARDIMRAKIQSRLIKWTEQELGWDEDMSEGVPWLEATGGFFRKKAWNPDAGRLIGRVIDVGEDGQPTGQPKDLHEGEIEPTICPYFEVYLENPFTSYRRQRSIVHAKAYPIEEIKAMWGVDVQEEPCDAYTLQATTIGVRGLGYGQGGYRMGLSKLKGYAMVKEYWERPSKTYPEGRFIAVAGNRLLYAGPSPYRVGRDQKPDIPFIHYVCIKNPGRAYGDCLIPRLIPVQRRYNAVRNRRAEFLNRVSIGQLDIESGSLENMDEIELNGTMPGQIFLTLQGRRGPRYLETGSLPADFDKEEQTCLQEFRALSGVSDLAKMSEAPAGVKSGVALELALEQDETRLAATVKLIEEAAIEDAKFDIRLYRQFAKAPRIARISDRSEVEVFEWTAADLSSDDVIIEGGSSLAESPAQRRQMVFDLLSNGLLSDPETGKITREGRSAILELIEFGHWETAADTDMDLQRAKGRRQIALIKTGRLPAVTPIDDPVIQLQELRRWMLSIEFEELQADQNIALAAFQYQAELMEALQVQSMQMAQQNAVAGLLPAGQPAQGAPAPAAM